MSQAQVYMSFASEEGFLGAAIVSVATPVELKDQALMEAIREAWRLGINPGGQVAAWVMPPDTFLVEDLNRLLSRSEAENLKRNDG